MYTQVLCSPLFCAYMANIKEDSFDKDMEETILEQAVSVGR